MTEIPFVKREEADLARQIEKRLLTSPKRSGILFVGVEVSPTRKDEQPVFKVWVGCERKWDERTIHHLVMHLLQQEVSAGVKIEVDVHRGVSLLT